MTTEYMHVAQSDRPDATSQQAYAMLASREKRECSGSMAVLLLLFGRDKRPVHILSTLSQSVSRRERDGSVVDVSVPSAILTYTKYMGGVDLGDQLRKYYSVCLECVKNYFRCMHY